MRHLDALLALALLAGCSRRERVNPFDPANPATGGRPAHFVALAGQSFVELRWTPPTIAGDFGYQVFRRVQGESDFRAVGSTLPGSASVYDDLGLTNGLLHEYRLYFVFASVLGGLPAEDAATPGALRPWFADLGRRSLLEATSDGRHDVRSLATVSPETSMPDPRPMPNASR